MRSRNNFSPSLFETQDVVIFTLDWSFLRISFTTFSGGGVTVWGRFYTSGPSHTNHICYQKRNMYSFSFNKQDYRVSMLLLMEHKTSSPSPTFSKEWKWSWVKSVWELLLRRKINKKMRSLIESTQPQYNGGVLQPSAKKKLKSDISELLLKLWKSDFPLKSFKTHYAGAVNILLPSIKLYAHLYLSLQSLTNRLGSCNPNIW